MKNIIYITGIPTLQSFFRTSCTFNLIWLIFLAGGTIPLLEVTEGFNPGRLFEKYLDLRPENSVDYLFLHATCKKNPSFLEDPESVLFEANRKIGKNYVQTMCKRFRFQLISIWCVKCSDSRNCQKKKVLLRNSLIQF